MSGFRNTWKLCNAHRNCNTCSNCIDSWKRKATRHAANAQNLKYTLMCLMDDRTDRYETETQEANEVLQVIPINEQRAVSKFSKCGICHEKITLGGQHNTVVFPCGHTTCVTCYNNPIFRQRRECPYCRKTIDKAYRLWLDAEEPDTE